MDYGRGTTSGFTVTKSFVCVFILHIELSKPICGLLESYRVEKKSSWLRCAHFSQASMFMIQEENVFRALGYFLVGQDSLYRLAFHSRVSNTLAI